MDDQDESGSLMTTLSPKQIIVIDGNITIEMMWKDNYGVKLRITAPKRIKIDRQKKPE